MEKDRNGLGWFEDLRVFVYGTLKPGGFYWGQFCEGRVESWWRARVRGKLFHLSVGYPAAVFDEEGWVQGVVLELRDPESLAGLDALEGFDPAHRGTGRNEYDRLRVEAYRENSDRADLVWAYGMDLRGIERWDGSWIESGDWDPGVFPGK